MTKSTLAAVVAAAAGGDGTTMPEASVSLTLDSLKLQHPDVYAAAVGVGAAAEQARIAGIEAQAMPGHEAVITAHKADRSKTGADAAMAIVAAEKATRANQMNALSKDEEVMTGLRNAPVDTSNDPAATPKATVADVRQAASTFVAEQAAKGITVSAAQAVAHVTKK
jgi:hypothetical protein